MPNWGKRIDSLEALLDAEPPPWLQPAQGVARPSAPERVTHKPNVKPLPDPLLKFQTVFLAVCSCGWERPQGAQKIRENAMRTARQHAKLGGKIWRNRP
jgi:hypothetical protein